MRISKALAAFVLCLFVIQQAQGQQNHKRRSARSRSYHHYKVPRVSGRKAKTICPIFETSEYPYHGLGFKLGDPLGLTYKYYPNNRLSVALDFGKASSGLYNRYFREKFQSYITDVDTLDDDVSLSYSSHKVRTDLIGEFKVLYHIEADKISPGLKLYFGAGWEWKSTWIRYYYFYNKTTPNGGEILNEFRSFDRHRVTMGPQVVLGIEYAYFQLPVSAFMEIEYFTDIQADPGWRRFEGGVGLRYIF